MNSPFKQPEREKEIVKLSGENWTSTAIAKKYSITKQRVYQILRRNNINRSENKRAALRTKFVNILPDVNMKFGEDYIASKHGMSKEEMRRIWLVNSGTSLPKIYRQLRDNKIVVDYIKGDTATKLLIKESNILDNPNRLTSVNMIYRINFKNGTRRYPNIPNRSAGGTYESKRVLNYIKHSYEKKNMTFKEIAEKLNGKGYKTVQGVPFQMQNTRMKYLAL